MADVGLHGAVPEMELGGYLLVGEALVVMSSRCRGWPVRRVWLGTRCGSVWRWWLSGGDWLAAGVVVQRFSQRQLRYAALPTNSFQGALPLQTIGALS